ncbi:hypothetical protein KQH50_00020 [bacterium]|nr:hypothetical protein [bacterium]
MSGNIKNKLKKYYWIIPLFLVSLVYILDTRFFTSPPLRSDDWEQYVLQIVFNRIPFFDLTSRRPMLTSLMALASPIFGLQIQWYYVLNWLLLFLSAVIVYQIIREAFPRKPWLALPVALVFLVYPVNNARTWLVVINNTFALLLALVSILLLLLYRRSGRIYQLVIANFLFLTSLLTYEAALGLVLFAALILIIFPGKSTRSRRWAFSTIFFTGALFILWRLILQPQWVNLQDTYISNLETSLNALLSRYGLGAFTFLFNWTGPFLLGFGDLKYWVFLGLCLTTLVVILAFVPRARKAAKRNSDYAYPERVKQEKELLGIALIGALAWVAGYIPVIALWSPTFYSDPSRVNFSSIFGGSLALVAMIAFIITFFIHRKEQIRRILLIATIPLILLGIINQVYAQNKRVAAWEESKRFWQALFKEAPNFTSGTELIIVIPNYEKLGPYEMLPFRGDWDVDSALKVLYNNQDLTAEHYYMDSLAITENWTPVDGDYSQTVFVFLQPDEGSVRLIEDPLSALNLAVSVEGYAPESRITDPVDGTNVYRGLVD